MRARWERERELIGKLKTAKEQIEALKTEADKAQREGNLEVAAEIRYGKLPALEKQLDAAREEFETAAARGGSFLRAEVTEEDLAYVVSGWTGIPPAKISRPNRSGSDMEKRLRERVVGQDEGWRPSPPRFAWPARASRPNARRLFLSQSTGVSD